MTSKEQKQLEAVERRAADLQRERESLSVLLANARAEYATYQVEADSIFAQAERSGDTRRGDQAEEKLFKLSTAVKRKEAALRACERDIAENTAAVHEARIAVKQARIDAITAEARKIAEGISLSDVKGWQRLTSLHDEATKAARELRAEGQTPDSEPFRDPQEAYIAVAQGVYLQIGGSFQAWDRSKPPASALTATEALFDDRIARVINPLAARAGLM